MKKIILLAYRDFPWHTGLSWRMEGIVKQLSKKGFSVAVIVPLIYGFEKMDIPNVVFERVYLRWLRKKSPLGKIRAFFSWVYFQFRCMIKILKHARNTLLVQYEHYYCFPTAYFAKTTLKIPVIADDISLLHIRPELTSSKRKVFYLTEKLIVEKSSLVITASNITKKVIEKRFSAAKLLYLPNGVEKITLKKSQREKCILFVGNLRFEQNVKAVQNIFQIVQRLIKYRTDFKVYIVGSPLKPIKHLLVHELVKAGIIKFLGGISENRLRQVFSGSLMALLPFHKLRRWGGQMTKTLRLMSYGMCVVATSEAVAGINEVKKGIHYVPFKDFDDCANILSFLLEKPEYCKRIGKNAKNLIEKNYSWDVLCKKYVRAIKTLNY